MSCQAGLRPGREGLGRSRDQGSGSEASERAAVGRGPRSSEGQGVRDAGREELKNGNVM